MKCAFNFDAIILYLVGFVSGSSGDQSESHDNYDSLEGGGKISKWN